MWRCGLSGRGDSLGLRTLETALDRGESTFEASLWNQSLLDVRSKAPPGRRSPKKHSGDGRSVVVTGLDLL